MQNATAMLRLLESQLREELEHLQRAVGSFTINNDESSKKKLTKVMRGKLRNTTVSLDLICGQPSCPICSEDFILGGPALRIPCSHIFHKDCVLPWLEMKQTCPICRAELNGDLPSKEEIAQFSADELTDRLHEADVVIINPSSKTKEELVDLLHEKWSELHRKDTTDIPTSVAASGRALHNNNFNFTLQVPSGALDNSYDDDDDDEEDTVMNGMMMGLGGDYSLIPTRVPGRLFHSQQQQSPARTSSFSIAEMMSRSERPARASSTSSSYAANNNHAHHAGDHLRWSFSDTHSMSMAAAPQPLSQPNPTTYQIVPSSSANGEQQQYTVVAHHGNNVAQNQNNLDST
jgi:hypothetical protein